MNKSKQKNKIFQIIRRGIQLMAFLFVPGLFTSTFYAFRTIYQTLITGNLEASAYLPSFLILLATIPLTAILGRFFCGFFCSFGSMGDFIWFLSQKTLKPKFRMPRNLDQILKYIKYALLVFLILFAWTLQLPFLDSSLSPWTVFGVYATVKGWTTAKYLFTFGGLLLLLIMIGSFFVERFFCRYLCPLGAIYAITSKLRFFHIRKNRSNCGKCTLCSAKCSMGIPLHEVDKVTSGECINCFNCVEVCPKHNAKTAPDPALAATVSIVAMTGLVYAGNTVNAMVTSTLGTSTTTSTQQMAKGIYTDGTYTGSGMGFRGDTQVEVEVSNGNITDITVTSYQDDDEYFNRAKSTVISEIIENQSTDVTAVSGATFSSKGIMNAVANALSKTTTASQDTTTTKSQSTTQDTATTESQSTTQDTATTGSQSGSNDSAVSDSQTSSSNTYTDGTYTGTGTGFRGNTKVSVTVSGGKISDIEVVSYQDDDQFFNRAKSTVLSEIIKNQSVDVTAVSGATYSSNGIMEAVANALGVSYTNTNSGNGSGHGGFRH